MKIYDCDYLRVVGLSLLRRINAGTWSLYLLDCSYLNFYNRSIVQQFFFIYMNTFWYCPVSGIGLCLTSSVTGIGCTPIFAWFVVIILTSSFIFCFENNSDIVCWSKIGLCTQSFGDLSYLLLQEVDIIGLLTFFYSGDDWDWNRRLLNSASVRW
jgi:hypothetical protein